MSPLKVWKGLIKNKLKFPSVDVSHPEESEFEGGMYIESLNGDIYKTIVRSSAVTVSLAHEDVFSTNLSKVFIIYSCGSLLVRNNERREIISPGDALIVPSHNRLIIESFLKRNTVSLIMDVRNIIDTPSDNFNGIAWKKVSELTYGEGINKILLNYNFNYSDSFCEKNTRALISLLSLEVESHNKNKLGRINEEYKLSLLLSFMKKNITNNNFRISLVADFLHVSERMVQYILSKHNINFCDFLSTERCRILARKIMENPYVNVDVYIYESGFNSIATANRQFKEKFNETPKRFQKRQLETEWCD
ncbi:helix-turn-helix domain-containing protein [Escherichia coli]|uniref:helix-turn-helix domain-containing protein n=1 Tax=Escherichia coli TaxID=562 RepID=UPI000BEADD7E|nr:AraC family transcriptional regulator [Escherichia coli]